MSSSLYTRHSAILLLLAKTRLEMRQAGLVALGGKGSGNFGHAGRPGEEGGSGPGIGGVAGEVLAKYGTTSDPHKTSFILPDGTRIRRKSYAVEHPDMAGGPEKLETLFKEGVIRYTDGSGIEVGGPITEKQAQLIVDDYEHHFKSILIVDIHPQPGYMPQSRNFETSKVTADALRHWIKNPPPPQTIEQWQKTPISDELRRKIRGLGDLPGHEFHGNQWTSGSGKASDNKAEQDKQEKLSVAQTNPLAHPDFVLGGTNDPAVTRYVAAYGQEFEAAPLPDDIRRGEMKECYKNASLLVMSHPELTYAEGFAIAPAVGDDIVFQHAWAVDRNNKVVDPTWDRPEKGKYFGVKYDRASYLKYLYKAKIYGVIGSTNKNIRAATETGVPKLRALGDSPGHEFHGNQWTDGIGESSEDDFSSVPLHAVPLSSNGFSLEEAGIDRNGGPGDLDGPGFVIWAGSPGEKSKGSVSVELPNDSRIARVVDSITRFHRQGTGTALYIAARDETIKRGYEGLSGSKIEQSSAALALWKSLERKGLAKDGVMRALGDSPGHEFHGNQWTGPSAKDDIPPAFPFASQAPQYPEKGPPGISYFKGVIDSTTHVDALLHRDKQGKVIGILNHYPKDMPPWEKKGNVNIFVDPAHKRQGIGTALLKEASKRWPVSLKQQQYTTEGRKFITSLIKKNPKLRELGGQGSGNFGHAGRPGEVGGSGEGGTLIVHGSEAVAAQALLDKLPLADALKLSEVHVVSTEEAAKAITDDLTARYGLPAKMISSDAVMMVDGSIGKIITNPDSFRTSLGAAAARVADAKVGLTAALLGAAAKSQADIKIADSWLTKVGRGLVERLDDEMTGPYPKDFSHAIVKLLPGGPENEIAKLLTDAYPSAGIVHHLVEHWQEYAETAKHITGLEEWRGTSSVFLPSVVVMRRNKSLVYLDEMRTLGDVVGHDFHGNQWTEGTGAARQEKLKERQRTYEEFMQNAGYEDDESSVLFHGTASKAIESIKKNGLVPQGGKGADAWAIANDPHAPLSMYARQPAVFLTQDEEDARGFANYAVSVNPGSRAVVLQVDIPRDKASSLEKDRYASRAWRSLDRIPPEWIRRVTSRGELKALTAQDVVTIYAVVVVDSDQEKRLRKLEKLVTLGGEGSGNFGHAGRPGEVGGSAESGSSTVESRATDKAKFDELKSQWSHVNDELFQHVDHPDSPEAQKKIDELKEIVKKMHMLNADPGGLEGIGLPGGPRDIVIIGAGPGGLAAATMAGTDGLDTLLIDANTQVGGQAKFSSRVENYPGFPAGISGNALAAQMHEQALRVGADQKLGVAVTGMSYDSVTGMKTLSLSDGSSVEARSVVLAGGVEFKKAEFVGEDNPKVSYADSAKLAKAGAGGEVVVAGGSNGAAQAALLAAKESSHVTLISRKPIDISMSDSQARALRDHPKITVLEGHEIESFKDNVIHTSLGRNIPAKAVGIFFGGRTNSAWLPAQVQRSARNKVIVNSSLETHIPGVFAVGDMREGSIGRIGQSVGDGQIAVHGVFQHFEKLKRGSKP